MTKSNQEGEKMQHLCNSCGRYNSTCPIELSKSEKPLTKCVEYYDWQKHMRESSACDNATDMKIDT